MTTNPYDPTPYEAGSSHPAETGTSNKKDVAAEQGKAEANQLKSEAADSGRRVKETAKDQAVAVKEEAAHQAQDLFGQLRSDLREQVGPQQDRIASTVRSVSDEINALSRGEKPESDYVTGLLGSVSGRVESVASSLENKDARELLDDVRRFAARRPGTFLAVAAGIGLLAGRATRGAKDSDEITTDRQGAKEYFGVSGGQGQGSPAGAGVPTGAGYDQGYDRNLTATETSGYTPADPYAYRSDEQGEAARTYTDRVPGTVYPEQEGDPR
ncbi:hypothetical protein AVL61_16510 [Kocuria rosea subsp. polaris]|uniref:ATP synthase F0 subunit B n=1 Tax=Kocuria rosea subsp. polaris TaxID=136273 RepID=A0A0W8ICH3_KOCRO|nr:hypothetical protein [Kocuria polaris]KUG57637.1 hypothetical protein AVL61_16510 [Kocuria polaris]